MSATLSHPNFPELSALLELCRTSDLDIDEVLLLSDSDFRKLSRTELVNGPIEHAALVQQRRLARERMGITKEEAEAPEGDDDSEGGDEDEDDDDLREPSRDPRSRPVDGPLLRRRLGGVILPRDDDAHLRFNEPGVLRDLRLTFSPEFRHAPVDLSCAAAVRCALCRLRETSFRCSNCEVPLCCSAVHDLPSDWTSCYERWHDGDVDLVEERKERMERIERARSERREGERVAAAAEEKKKDGVAEEQEEEEERTEEMGEE